jgi:alkylhydroperoxidase family enzyme
MVEQANEPAELRPVFDQLRATRGRVPGMYRTLAHHPGVLAAHRAYFHAALDAGVLPRAFKEKIAYKSARACGSAYSSASHRSYAIRHGASEAELDAIDRGDYGGLPERERAALEFAESMVANRGRVDDALFARLQACYAPAELVEIVALVGIMELASVFGEVFGLAAD